MSARVIEKQCQRSCQSSPVPVRCAFLLDLRNGACAVLRRVAEGTSLSNKPTKCYRSKIVEQDTENLRCRADSL